VTINNIEADIQDVNGTYEWTSIVTGAIESRGGYNDTDGDNKGVGEPNAPLLKAPKGYENVNPYTTMIVDGVDLNTLKMRYPYAGDVNTTRPFDFDVVAMGQLNLDIAKDTAKAALDLASAQQAKGASAFFKAVARGCDFPDGCEPASSAADSSQAVSSESSVSSAVASSECNSDFPDGCEPASSAADSSQAVSSEASSSSSGDFPPYYGDIDNCGDYLCVSNVVKQKQIDFLGAYTTCGKPGQPPCSSSEAASSEAASSEAASSEVASSEAASSEAASSEAASSEGNNDFPS